MTKTFQRSILTLTVLFSAIFSAQAKAETYSPPNNYDLCQNAECNYREQTLRTAIEVACSNEGDDTIDFRRWSTSFPGSHVIVVDNQIKPLVIPADCKGKINLIGRNDSNVDVTLDGRNTSTNQCVLTIESKGNLIQDINIVGSGGKGLCISGSDNRVARTYIGRQRIAKVNNGNRIGIEVTGASNSIYESIVVASTSHGVILNSDGNTLSKDFIGTTAENETSRTRSASFGNGGDGVQVNGSYNRIGGSPTLKNWVTSNKGTGIAITGGAESEFNDLGFNTIYGNTKLGIDLGNDGVTQPGSCSNGPNACLAYPTQARSEPNGTNSYLLQAVAPAGSEVQVYIVNANDNDTNGEGQLLLGKVNVPAGPANETRSFSYNINSPLLEEGVKVSMLTSRASVSDRGNLINTSEFSGVITLSDSPSGLPDPRPPAPGDCGNGVVDANEDCDDGNTANGDCCNSICQFDAEGTECDDSNAGTDNDQCDGAGTCVGIPPGGIVCGDNILNKGPIVQATNPNATTNTSPFQSIVDRIRDAINPLPNLPTPPSFNIPGVEECDDGNTSNGDCCNSVCQFEADGSNCDDGNPNTDNDQCNGQGTCQGTTVGNGEVCGNGLLNGNPQLPLSPIQKISDFFRDRFNITPDIDLGPLDPNREQCDDGNTANGDCCSATCGFDPSGTSCDDGNAGTTNDQCNGQGECVGTPPGGDPCGSGVVTGNEQCDDGNTANGDCCNSTCQFEAQGSTCDDANANTTSDQCDGAGECGGTPTGPTDCDPTNLIATAVSSQQIDLSWVDNCDNESGFYVERAKGACTAANLSFEQVGSTGININIYHDLGAPTPPLDSETTYCYRVRAFFPGADYSNYTNLDDATTFAAPVDLPRGPTHLIATAISSSQIDVNWVDDSNNETGFELWRSQGDCSNFVLLTNSIPANVTTYVDSGLQPSTLYCYRVRAFNPVGASNFSNADDATTFPAPTNVPTPATNLNATAVSSAQIDVTWDDNADNEDGYKLERSEHPQCEQGLGFVELNVPLGANTTSYNDTGLDANKRYCYRVRPYNSQGNGAYSNIDDATTLPIPTTAPNAPINLNATGVTSSRIDVQFVDTSDNETGFVLERANGACADNNPFAAVANLPASQGINGAVHYSDTGLPPNTVFCYRVRAENQVGPSAYSNTDDASTQPIPTSVPLQPIDLVANATGPHQITVTWTDASNNEDEYVIQRAPGLCSAGNPFAEIASIPAVPGSGSTVTFIDNTVDDNTSYCYRVIAHNVAGDSLPSNTDDATTPPEAACLAGDVDNDNICDDNLEPDGDDQSGEGPDGTDTDGDGTPDAGDTDTDSDTIADEDEEGDGDVNTPPVDTDNDGTPDFRDEDSDNDGVPDEEEAGDNDPNTPPVDTDGDGTPDFQDTDSDNDGVLDGENGTPIDNCRIVVNPDQVDSDGNGRGDACDPVACDPGSNPQDVDCDGVPNDSDNCPNVFNPGQEDDDEDGIGNVCDPTPQGNTPLFPSLQGSGCSLANTTAQTASNLIPLGMILMPGLFMGMIRRRNK